MGDTDLELAQLLCTRLCHDLAGPVGAVAAGVELIGDDPAQVDAETLGLIGSSSAAASAKLKFLRVALGAAAGGAGDPKALLEGYLEATAGPAGKPQIKWPAFAVMVGAADVLGPRWTPMLLNLCLLALESQPSCRALAVDVVKGPALVVTVDARGAPDRTSAVRADLAAAVADSDDATPLSAKTVQAHMAGRLVRACGGAVSLAASGNGVIVTAMFQNDPAAS